MSVFEGSSSQLTQGISQQIPRDRLPGQVEDQLNMLSDLTTGPRRRPGAQLRKAVFASNDSEYGLDSFFLGYTDISGNRYRVVVDTSVGDLSLYDNQYNLQEVIRRPYLKASSARAIQVAVVGDRLIVANTEKKPKPGPVKWHGETNQGYWFIRQGAFSKKFDVTITDLNNGQAITFEHFTLDAAQPNAAIETSPEAILWRLYDAWVALDPASKPFEVSMYAEGSCMFVKGPAGSNLSITTNSGDTYVQTSSARQLATVAGLPPVMHPNGQWLIMAIGRGVSLVHYRWDVELQAWVESPSAGRPDTLLDVPLVLSMEGTNLTVVDSWPGCQAGDENANPDPEFLNYGVTGLAAYQGRLVVLSGPFVSLSASKDPKQFYRTTVDSLLDSDPIHIGSSANMAAPYQYAVPFQKDLLLFADRYQAVIPGGNTAITPRTAMVVVTSEYVSDLGCAPIGLGRTVMYSTPRNAAHFGVMEMAPSSYTDSLYTSHDVTNHLPRWFKGKARWAVSSSISSMAAYGGTAEPRDLYVHEYLWSGDEKVQQAWHRWQLPYPVVACCFAADELEFLLMLPGRYLALVSIDPRQRSFPGETPRTPFLDLFVPAQVVNHTVDLPGQNILALAGLLGDINLEQADGPLAGEAVGIVQRTGPVPTPNTGGPAPGDGYEQVVVPFAVKPALIGTVQRLGTQTLELLHKVPDGYAAVWVNPVGALGTSPTLVVYDESGAELRSAELNLGKYGVGPMAGVAIDYSTVIADKVYACAFAVDMDTMTADYGVAVIDTQAMTVQTVDMTVGADLTDAKWAGFSTIDCGNGRVLATSFDGLYEFDGTNTQKVFSWPSGPAEAVRQVVLSRSGQNINVWAVDQMGVNSRWFTYNPTSKATTENTGTPYTQPGIENLVHLIGGGHDYLAYADNTNFPMQGVVRNGTLTQNSPTYGAWTYRPFQHMAVAALALGASGGIHMVGPTGWVECGMEGLPPELPVTHISMDGTTQFTGCSMQGDTFYLWRVQVDTASSGYVWAKPGTPPTVPGDDQDTDTTLKTVRSFPNGAVFAGLPYRSHITPTEPFVTDREGRKIGTNRCTLLRYIVSTAYSSEYMVELREKGWEQSDQNAGTVFWASTELSPDTPRSSGGDSSCIIPVRADTDRAEITFSQEGDGELNIVGLEFVLRYNPKLRRT